MNLKGLLIVVICLSGKSVNGSPCIDLQYSGEKVCEQTEYEAYRDCIEELKLSRQKRQAIFCPPLVVEPVIQTEKPFSILVPVKPLAVKRVPMLKDLDRTIIVRPDSNQIDAGPEDDENSVQYRVPVNVTTVIRLTNIVNNTNHIHMPTTLNNTNVNNIHVYTNLTEAADTESKPEPACCTAVRPKTCQTSTQGIHCKHHKFQTCGPHCTSKVIHIQKRTRCNRNTGECKEKVAYVPQPEKPTCVYIDDWPYVVCGKLANMTAICAGCYDHYGYGYEAFNGHSRMQDHCRGCYDDAFDVGPKYRRGPVLRPFYYHQAPCYIAGDCADSYDNCAFGCYGHDQIDPAWGNMGRQSFDPMLDPSNTVYNDSDDFYVSNEISDDWGVPTNKCAVVTDGTTIAVKNCTQGIDNPYIAAPASNPHYVAKWVEKNSTTSTNTSNTSTNNATSITTQEEMDDYGSADGITIDEEVLEDEYAEE